MKNICCSEKKRQNMGCELMKMICISATQTLHWNALGSTNQIFL